MEEDDENEDFLREIIMDLTTQRSGLQNQLLELETSNRCLQRQVTEMREEVEARAFRGEAGLHSHYNALREEHELMTKQSRADIRRMRCLEEKNEELLRDVAQLTRKLEEDTKVKDDALAEGEVLRSTNTALTEKVTSTLMEMETLRANVAKMGAEDFEAFYLRKITRNTTPQQTPRPPSPPPPPPAPAPVVKWVAEQQSMQSGSPTKGGEGASSCVFKTHREQRGVDHVLGEKGVPGSVEHMVLVKYIGRGTSVWEPVTKVEEIAPEKLQQWRNK